MSSTFAVNVLFDSSSSCTRAIGDVPTFPSNPWPPFGAAAVF
jgi:hypothetical protein